MFAWLGKIVARHWLLVILIWIGIIVTVKSSAPRWDDITHDGDVSYLPDDRPSIQGEKLLELSLSGQSGPQPDLYRRRPR